ncbi:hypothetical protein BB347_02690 [Natronorubrum daqingense]|uniref:Uncharacterized protein n=1 Tax=Natronorubrum daqingense TaxID=588898 RepID=A0A1P8RA92_9EURY|nr:hypothetical protein BB347_02690 [Natronorubrum daqingense]
MTVGRYPLAPDAFSKRAIVMPSVESLYVALSGNYPLECACYQVLERIVPTPNAIEIEPALATDANGVLLEWPKDTTLE